MRQGKVTEFLWKVASYFLPDLRYVKKSKEFFDGRIISSEFENPVKLNPPYLIHECRIGKYTYISQNAIISYTTIGKFCSIGPNLVCGWGKHPVDGISTSPMFYSTKKQNGYTLAKADKIDERASIRIGNDVFIGMNVTILDGVSVGDGAVIGAGCIVSKDVPAYAIVAGNPMKVLRSRFDEKTIESFLSIKWWDFPEDKLQEIEEQFFKVEDFISRHSENYPQQ